MRDFARFDQNSKIFINQNIGNRQILNFNNYHRYTNSSTDRIAGPGYWHQNFGTYGGYYTGTPSQKGWIDPATLR